MFSDAAVQVVVGLLRDPWQSPGTARAVPHYAAFVVGINEYTSASMRLTKSVCDAEDTAIILKAHGYTVTTLLNCTATQFRVAFDAWLESLPNDTQAVVYFSGQGHEIDGKQCVLGMDARDSSPAGADSSQAYVGCFIAVQLEGAVSAPRLQPWRKEPFSRMPCCDS